MLWVAFFIGSVKEGKCKDKTISSSSWIQSNYQDSGEEREKIVFE